MKMSLLLISVLTLSLSLLFSANASAVSGNLFLPLVEGESAELAPQNPESDELLRVAFDLYKQKKFDEALANCEKASKLNPNDFRPHILTAYVYTAQRKLKDASASMATAITLQPRRKELYLDKAQGEFHVQNL